jgi:hypothetical protein
MRRLLHVLWLSLILVVASAVLILVVFINLTTTDVEPAASTAADAFLNADRNAQQNSKGTDDNSIESDIVQREQAELTRHQPPPHQTEQKIIHRCYGIVDERKHSGKVCKDEVQRHGVHDGVKWCEKTHGCESTTTCGERIINCLHGSNASAGPEPLITRARVQLPGDAVSENRWFSNGGWTTQFLHVVTVLNRIAAVAPQDQSRYVVNIGTSWGFMNGDPAFQMIGCCQYDGFLLEAIHERFVKMRQRWRDRPGLTFFEGIVTPKTVGAVLTNHSVPRNLDLFKMDIDGYDCLVIENMLEVLHPKVIAMEVNQFIPPPIKFTVEFDERFVWQDMRKLSCQGAKCTGRGVGLYGCSLAYAVRLMESHGYFLLQLDVRDAIFVENRYKNNFGVLNNDINNIYKRGSVEREIGKESHNPQFVPVVVQKKWRSMASAVEQAAAIRAYMEGESDVFKSKLGYEVPFSVEA